MIDRSRELAALRRQSRNFTEVAFALMALTALALALVIHHTGATWPIADEARAVMAWSLLGLAALDAALLVGWARLGAWIAGEH